MENICINSPEYITGIVGTIVIGASTIANFVPEPDKINNSFLRFLSRVIHFVAVDIVTAKQ